MSVDRPDGVGDFRWMCLSAVGGRELCAESSLLDKGVSAFCPLEMKAKRVSRWAKRKEMIANALFPGYLFAGFLDVENWPTVFRVKEVKSVLGLYGEPIEVPRKAMERVFSLSGSNFNGGPQRIRSGIDVEVVDGPFVSALRGRLSRVQETRTGEAKLLLSIFGRQTGAWLPFEFLRIA